MSWSRYTSKIYQQKVNNTSTDCWAFIFYDYDDATKLGFAARAMGMCTATTDGRPNTTPTAEYYIDGTLVASVSLPYKDNKNYCYYYDQQTIYYNEYGSAAYPDTPSNEFTVTAAASHSWKVIVHYGTYYTATFEGTTSHNVSAGISADSTYGKIGAQYKYTASNTYSNFTYKVYHEVADSYSGGTYTYKTVETVTLSGTSGSWTPTIAQTINTFRASGSTLSSIRIRVTIETFSGSTSCGTASITGYLYYPTISGTMDDLTAGHSGKITLGGDAVVTSGNYLHVLFYGSSEVGRWTGSGEKSYIPSLDTFAPLITTSTGKTFSFTLKAYTGSTVSDSYLINSASVSGYVSLESDDVCPQPTLTLTDASGIFQMLGKYLVGNSYLNGSVSDGLRYSATAKSRRTDINNTYYTDATFTTGVIESVYVTSVSVSVTDSRGLTGYAEYTIAICDWHTPALPTASIHRGYYVDGVWTANDKGNYVKIDWGIDVSPVENTNAKTLTITAPDGTHSITPAAYDSTGALYSEASTEKSYDIVLVIADSYSSLTRTLRLSTAGVVMDIKAGGKGVGFGKVAEEDNVLDISSDWDVYVHGMTLKEYIQAVVAGTV